MFVRIVEAYKKNEANYRLVLGIDFNFVAQKSLKKAFEYQTKEAPCTWAKDMKKKHLPLIWPIITEIARQL